MLLLTSQKMLIS